MKIRVALKEDNQKLIELCHASPMKGIITAYVDRTPDFFALSDLQGEERSVWVAEEEESGEVIGCVAVAHREAMYRGQKVKMVYGGDLKVHPKSRGSKLGVKLTRFAVEHGYAKGDDLGVGVVIQGNKRALEVVDGLSDDIKWVRGGFFNLYQVLPYRAYREVIGYKVRRAVESDIPAMANLLRETYAEYSCAPVFTEEWLSVELNRNPAFTISNFRIAEFEGKLVACAAFWDMEEIRRTIVQKFSLSASLIIGALKLIRPLWGIPKPPKEGESLRHVFLRFPAAVPGYIEGLRAIMHSESNALKSEGVHQFIWASFHEADPLSEAVNEMWKMNMKVNLFLFKFSDKVELFPPEEMRKTPAYIDFALV